MIDSIVMYPLEPMTLATGLNVLGFQLPSLLYKFVDGLQGNGEEVVLGEEDDVASIAKEVLYIGDCADVIDYDAIFQKTAIKQIIDKFDSDRLTRVLALQAELKTIIQDEIWDDDLPLMIPSSLDLRSAVMMTKPRVDVDSVGSLFDKIQMVVNTADALAESRMLVMLHTIQYCDNDQLMYLHKDLLRHHMQLLDLECCNERIILAEGRSHYVDKDYVQFS